MAEEREEWGVRLDVPEAEAIAYLKASKSMMQPSLWGHTWGRPGDEFYSMTLLELKGETLQVEYEYGFALNILRPQGFSLWRDRIHFGIWGSDLERGSVTLVIEKARVVRWEKKTPEYEPSWAVEFWGTEGGGFELREMKGSQIFWQNHVVAGKPAFSAELDRRY